MVVVITRSDDPESDLVTGELARRGADVARFDIADFPTGLRVASTFDTRWSGGLSTPGGDVALESVRAVYYRRPTRFAFPAGMSGPEREFAGAESRNGLGGLLACLDCRWVNHPGRVADAEYKPLQLETAARCGLPTPKTLLTNDRHAVEAFAAELDEPLLYKPLSPGVVREGDGLGLVYTTVVDPAELDQGGLDVAMHLFQEWVPKARDARVTVVGERVFAVAIHARSARARVDWRADYDALDYEPVEPPERVRAGVLGYLHRLGLSFGAFDFTVTPGGAWVFLECNPAGLWGWIEEDTGLPIAASLADLLAGEQP